MTTAVIDPDVQAVAEFMETRIAANRLVGVASGIAALAPALWSHYPSEPVAAAKLERPALIADAGRMPPTATE